VPDHPNQRKLASKRHPKVLEINRLAAIVDDFRDFGAFREEAFYL
jgi:hypothetical protein